MGDVYENPQWELGQEKDDMMEALTVKDCQSLVSQLGLQPSKVVSTCFNTPLEHTPKPLPKR